jgi:phage baseplate assembly protein W
MPTREPIGWPLLPLPDDNGRLAWPALESSLAQQVQVILRTRPGEQLMRPTFGAGLEDFLHEPNHLTTRRRIRDRLVESLRAWERRLQVEDVAVLEVPDAPHRLRVEITYRVRRTGNLRRTGLTLEFES